jgi:multidrug efflux pump subunit AcrA (membrane-fusion protein)
MTAETNIIIRETADALLVPTSAVDKDRTWRVIDGKLAETPVTVGVRGADRTEILGGLAADDVIVVAPETSFSGGERVRTSVADRQ